MLTFSITQNEGPPARLRELQLPSMQSHILRTTSITVYNLFHGNLNLQLEEFFDEPAVNHLRGHQFEVRQPRFQLARWQAAFAVRVVGPWNRLPASVAETPSLNVFKERLNNCWATIFTDLTLSLVNLLSTVHGFGTQVLFPRPVNSDSDCLRLADRLNVTVLVEIQLLGWKKSNEKNA